MDLNLIDRPVESHSGAQENILAGQQNIFAGPIWKNIFFKFFFLRRCILVYFIFFEQRRAPPNVAGPGVTYPGLLPHPLNEPADR